MSFMDVTKTAGNRFALVLTMALAGGSWLAAGLIENPGEASVHPVGEAAAVAPSGDGWLWSAAGETSAAYAWAEGDGSEETSTGLAGDLSWDDSLRLDTPVSSDGES